MKILLLLLLAIPLVSVAQTAKNEIWNIGNDFYSFTRDSKTNVLISTGCEAKREKCNAYVALLGEKKEKLSEKDLVGGKNPGSVRCSKLLGGTVLILKDIQENENAFCKFKDGSLVSASSL